MKLKNKINSGEATIGSWITIGHPSIIEIMASAKFDWLAIDMEHSPISAEKCQDLILASQSKNMPVLVRVGGNDDYLIKRAMDSGADGVIVPMVKTKKEAEIAVQSTKYPPIGNRGVGLARAQEYGLGFKKYNEWQKKNSIVIIQIEHIDAVNNINEIIAVEGVDSIIIGPYDLSASLQCPGDFKNPILIEAIEVVERACNKIKFPLGYHVIEPSYKLVKEKLNSGYKFIGFSLDFLFLGNNARKEVEKLKNE